MRIWSLLATLAATLTLAGCFELPLAELDATPSEQPFQEAALYDAKEGVTIHLRAADGAYLFHRVDDDGSESEDVPLKIWEVEPELYVAAAAEARGSDGAPQVALAGILFRDGERFAYFPACSNDVLIGLAESFGATRRKQGFLTYCSFETMSALFDFARALPALDLDEPSIEPLRDQTVELEIVSFVK